MASSSLVLALTTLCILCSLQATVAAAKTIQISHYTHEIRGGPNSTLLLAAGVGGEFGSIVVYDNTVKAGESDDSQVLGRAVGKAVGVVKPSSMPNNQTRVQLEMQHIFMEGSPYNGSMVNVMGIFFSDSPWEMSVPGATGKLRGYTGYGICTLVSETTGDEPVFLVYRWDFYLTKT